MGDPDGSTDVWIRTTSTGIIPHAAASAGSGSCYLGTSTWYFGYAYIDHIYGSSFSGNSATATADGDGNTITSTYAKLATYNNLIHSGNEFTFVPAQYSGSVWLNYRTASGSTDGNIAEYIFGNGKG
jgi:hypothetical protein